MNKVRLGDVATYINGYAFKPEDRGTTGLPIIRIQDLTGNSYDLGFYNGEYPEKIEINNGDVLISWSASLGVYVWNKGKALLNQHIFKVVFDKLEIDKQFFVYAVEHNLQEMVKQTHGATMKHIIKKDFDNTLIPYPPLEQQKRIAKLLDKTCDLIEKMKMQVSLLDELIKSQFVEMFGDPEINPLSINNYPWKEIFYTQTGKLDSNAAVVNGEYPFFTCSKEALSINEYAYDCEALLLAGNNAAGIYDVKYYKGKFNAYQRTYILQLQNKDWKYAVFKHQLEDKLLYLQSQSKGTNTRYLTMGILSQLSFLVPPIELQNQFADFVTQVEKQKSTIQQSIDKLETLKKSLMQKYFG